MPYGTYTSRLSTPYSAGGLRFLILGWAWCLRCFQHLSRPDLATLRCRFADNRHTRDLSLRVLSYYGELPSRIERFHWIETDNVVNIYVAIEFGLYLVR